MSGLLDKKESGALRYKPAAACQAAILYMDPKSKAAKAQLPAGEAVRVYFADKPTFPMLDPSGKTVTFPSPWTAPDGSTWAAVEREPSDGGFWFTDADGKAGDAQRRGWMRETDLHKVGECASPGGSGGTLVKVGAAGLGLWALLSWLPHEKRENPRKRRRLRAR